MAKTDDFPKTFDVLSTIPTFVGLDSSLLEAISRIAFWKDFNVDQIVFLEGEPCLGLYILQKGWLKAVKVSTTGREQIIRIVGPGETFNEIGVFTGGPNLVTVEALEQSRVWIIQREKLIRLMDENLPLIHIITQNLANQVNHLLRLVEDLSFYPVKIRFIRLLLEKSINGKVNRNDWSTQVEIAARLGTIPDVINRVIKDLVEESLIQMDRHQIRILDSKGLKKYTSITN